MQVAHRIIEMIYTFRFSLHYISVYAHTHGKKKKKEKDSHFFFCALLIFRQKYLYNSKVLYLCTLYIHPLNRLKTHTRRRIEFSLNAHRHLYL